QTTFLNAYRAYVEKGNRPEKPQNWLIAIAHNVCRQRFRQSARRPSEVSFEDDIADTISDDEMPTGEDIRRALGHLAFNQRAALVMRELEGRSYAEIAEILDLSTSAVETLIFRARRALREQLEGTLTCGQAEFAISRQLDGRLSRQDKGQLRAHLRECKECATFARRQRAQRSALKSLALIPVPSSLGSFFGGSGAAVGGGLAIKAAAAVTAGLAIGAAGYEGVRHSPWLGDRPAAASVQPSNAAAGGLPASALVARDRRTELSVAVRDDEARTKIPPGQVKKAGPATAKAKKKPKAEKVRKGKHLSRGHAKKQYAGDASVAARHAKVRPAKGNRKAAPPKPKAEVQAKLPPGPFDAQPPKKNK
ncbi:MAG TPA: sigma-70 family RNA polymerase sigma factor, partial [Microvirga sp.]|nr:sigma-70 family RNA polymerase sigma factor [Microvirga sp.]